MRWLMRQRFSPRATMAVLIYLNAKRKPGARPGSLCLVSPAPLGTVQAPPHRSSEIPCLHVDGALDPKIRDVDVPWFAPERVSRIRAAPVFGFVPAAVRQGEGFVALPYPAEQAGE